DRPSSGQLTLSVSGLSGVGGLVGLDGHQLIELLRGGAAVVGRRQMLAEAGLQLAVGVGRDGLAADVALHHAHDTLLPFNRLAGTPARSRRSWRAAAHGAPRR